MMNKLKFGAMKFSVSRKFSLEIETKTERDGEKLGRVANQPIREGGIGCNKQFSVTIISIQDKLILCCECPWYSFIALETQFISAVISLYYFTSICLLFHLYQIFYY